ncbi:uncharacterized protein LOC125537081 [Triticum urartu]|nr:uncharacterized protein LOC125537081 [Triticum urartu]
MSLAEENHLSSRAMPSSPAEEEHPSSPPSPEAATPEKIDDIAELNITEDLDNRPSKKAKNVESGVLEPSLMSPTISASTPISECFESIVLESDNQIDHDQLPSPPSPSSSTPVSNKEIKVDETYDYLPQDYALTDHDLCAHIAIESSLRKELLVQIDGSSVRQNQLMCLLDEKEWVNDDVIYAYIYIYIYMLFKGPNSCTE